MLSLNVLLSLIIQAKRKGKGIVPNGKIYTSLMLCVSDFGGENEVLTCFNNETVAKESYRKLERFLSRFQRDGKGYPYELFSFGQLENSVGDTEKMAVYPRKMEKLCSSMLAAEKLDALTYTLLEALRQDSKIRTVLYGCEVIPKEKLLGSYAHPKRICIEALLVGMLYHVHKHPSEAERIELLECPDKRTFQTVHFGDNNSLELGLTISQNENIRLNAKRQKPEKLRYQLEFRYDETVYTELPKTGNMFIYGTGGVGKTSVLKSLVSDEETVYFYFPLYQYRAEVHENFSRQNIWILLNILLKYHYQYEYAAYEVLAANEGEENILQQLNELEKMLCSIPVSKKISTILLDAFNEIPTDEQSGFVRELEHIMDKWKNVRIVVAGRTVPQYDVFREFKKAEITGITKTELSNQLKGSTANEQMLEILRIPLFLNLYLSDIGGKRTKGELLDSYFMSRQGDDVIRFIVMFSLPLIGKEMSGAPVCSEITRADALKAVNKSMKLYLNDQYVYQNYIAPRKINKKVLQESRKSDDWIELILSRTGIMAVSECDPNKLHFAHEYYRDYFAARHILNAIEACRCVYHHIPKGSSVFWDFGLSGIWFDIYAHKEPYRLIGEICGDFKNVTDPRYCVHRTALDDFLDLCYRFTVVRGMENLINTMFFSRNGVLRYVSFTGQNLPILPTFCRYEKCDFSDSRIIYVPLFDKDNYFYAVHGDIIVIVFCGYTDAAVWDMRRNTLIGDYNFFDHSDKVSEFYYAEFSENGSEISLFSDISVLRFDVYTGEVKEQINGFDEVKNESWYKRYLSSHNKQSDLDSIFLEQVNASLNRFKDCDFTGVDMPDKNDLLMLEKMNDGQEFCP